MGGCAACAGLCVSNPVYDILIIKSAAKKRFFFSNIARFVAAVYITTFSTFVLDVNIFFPNIARFVAVRGRKRFK